MATDAALRERYRHAIEDVLGWETTTSTDRLTFTHNDTRYRLNLDATDPAFLFITASYRRSTDSAECDARAAVETSARCKCAKVTVSEGAALIAVEMFVAAPDSMPSVDMLVAVLPRAASAIEYAAMCFDEFSALAGIETASNEA